MERCKRIKPRLHTAPQEKFKRTYRAPRLVVRILFGIRYSILPSEFVDTVILYSVGCPHALQNLRCTSWVTLKHDSHFNENVFTRRMSSPVRVRA